MTKRGILLVLGAISIGVALVPATRTATLVKGVDTYNTHRLVFGNRTFSQEITSSNPITGIGLILVDIRKSNNLMPAEVIVRDHDGNTLTTGTIDPTDMINSTFAYANFTEEITLPDDGAIVDVQSREATIDNALGWRFDPEEPDLQRFENGILQEGSFAIQLRESVPLWKKITSLAFDNPKESFGIASVLSGIILFSFLAIGLSGDETTNRKKQTARVAVIIVIAIAAFTTRMYAQQDMGGVSGGDPYNYLLIARSLTLGENPFISAKRLPGYPLLLTPTVIWPNIDAHVYMRTLSALAASGSIFLVFLLARHLRLTWPAQLFAATALAWQADFFATSLRPEPYSVFGLLLLATLVLFFSATKRWQWILFGLLLGYSAMVRQEGFVLAALLGIAAVVREVYIKQSDERTFHYKKLLWMFLPALAIVSPFFISNTIQFGNPFYTPYFEGERLQIVDSPHAFNDASISTWSIITSMWKPSWVQQELLMPYDDKLIPIFFLITIAWWVIVVHKKLHLTHPKILWGTSAITIIVLTWAMWGITTNSADIFKNPPFIIAGILLVAPALFLAKTRWPGMLLFAVLLSQLLIATWFHPFAKHYQQSYPLIALLIAGALFNVKIPKERLFTAYSLVAAWLIPFALPLLILYSHLGIFVDSHNASSALDSVLYRSARSARTLPGPYGHTIESLPAQLYHGLENIVILEEDKSIPDIVRTVVITEEVSKLRDMPDTWHMTAEFKSEGKNEVLYVSQVWTY